MSWAATAAPSRAIGRSGELGSLAAGAAGDAAVFAVDEGRFPYQDADGNALECLKRWAPRLTVRLVACGGAAGRNAGACSLGAELGLGFRAS